MVTWYDDGSRSYSTTEMLGIAVVKLILILIVVGVIVIAFKDIASWLGSW